MNLFVLGSPQSGLHSMGSFPSTFSVSQWPPVATLSTGLCLEQIAVEGWTELPRYS